MLGAKLNPGDPAGFNDVHIQNSGLRAVHTCMLAGDGREDARRAGGKLKGSLCTPVRRRLRARSVRARAQLKAHSNLTQSNLI